MSELGDKAIAVHDALDAAALPHALGGALALAWCTEQARGTGDIDINVFVAETASQAVLDALPPGATRTARNRTELSRDGQTRVLWDGTPIDLFLNTTSFHGEVMTRVSLEPFEGRMLPFLSCTDLAVFKAFFNRRRDWADIEDMVRARTIDATFVSAIVTEHLGPDDPRLAELRSITG